MLTCQRERPSTRRISPLIALVTTLVLLAGYGLASAAGDKQPRQLSGPAWCDGSWCIVTVTAMDSSGKAVGMARGAFPFSSLPLQALAWDALGERPRDLTLNGPFSSFTPMAVNQAGRVAGTATISLTARHAVRASLAGDALDLGTLGGSESEANDINESGQVVGAALLASGERHGFVWTEQSGMQDLGTLGGPESVATAVNASGHIVGYSRTLAGETHAFFWTLAGGLTDLGTLGGTSSRALDINADDVVVGEARRADGHLRAFLWTPSGGLRDFTGTGNVVTTSAVAINDAGAVTGQIEGDAPLSGPFLWTDTNGLVRLGQGEALAVAKGIRTDGLVFGIQNYYRPFIRNTTELAFAYPAVWRWSWDDLLVDSGRFGLWAFGNNPEPWVGLHNLDPVTLQIADVDANGIQDVVVAFGAPYGVWLWLNRSTWQPLHNLTPSRIIATDLDLSDGDELVFDFPGAGLWTWSRQSGWSQLHPMNTLALIPARTSTVTRGLFASFRGFGVWRLSACCQWDQVDGRDATILVEAADLGSGPVAGSFLAPRLIMNFPGAGIWQRREEVVWNPSSATYASVMTTTPLHPLGATAIVSGEIDGIGLGDLAIDFGPAFGVWTVTSFTDWQQLHPFTSVGLALADLDGLGRDEIVVNFRSYGLWRYSHVDGWLQLNTQSIDSVLPATLH